MTCRARTFKFMRSSKYAVTIPRILFMYTTTTTTAAAAATTTTTTTTDAAAPTTTTTTTTTTNHDNNDHINNNMSARVLPRSGRQSVARTSVACSDSEKGEVLLRGVGTLRHILLSEISACRVPICAVAA